MAGYQIVIEARGLNELVQSGEWETAAQVARSLTPRLHQQSDTDGLYRIGWASFMRAPEGVRSVLATYNDTLRALTHKHLEQKRPQGHTPGTTPKTEGYDPCNVTKIS